MKQLGDRIDEFFERWKALNADGFRALASANIFGPDWMAEIEQQVETELALRRDQAAKLTRAAHVYGYRDANVVWLQDPEQFAFIHLDGLVCANIPEIGKDYESAMRWIREEANDQ